MSQINNSSQEKTSLDKFRFSHLVSELISSLSSRSKEIMEKRYGLKKGEGETLEEIGQEYDITRERVRQIIADSIKTISKFISESRFQEMEKSLLFTIEKNNGIIKEKEIVEKFNLDGVLEANAIKFFANCSNRIKMIEEKGILSKSWVLSVDIKKDILRLAQTAQNILEKEKCLLNDKQMAKKLSSEFSEYSLEQILSYLAVLERVKKNIFGKWGVISWPEVSPKGTRDKIYLVLKEENRPLHFTEIAALIDKHGLGKRKAHPQTVHNELIKDNRFILIGRGIYALSEWGYTQGTIKEVLTSILENSQRPLNKEEILQEVFKIRKVKKATVMINLNNNRIFERHKDSYSLKK